MIFKGELLILNNIFSYLYMVLLISIKIETKLFSAILLIFFQTKQQLKDRVSSDQEENLLI